MTQKKTKNEQHEKFSQAATSPGAQRRKKMPIVQNPAPVTKILQKSTSLILSAETCQAMSEAPAQPGRKNERPQTGQRISTGPSAGAGKAAGAEGDYTVAGRGSAASNRAARPCWVMMEISCNARASTAERSGSSAGACCFRKGSFTVL